MPVVEARSSALPVELAVDNQADSGAGSAPALGGMLRRRTLAAALLGVALALLLAWPAAQQQAHDEIDSAMAAARLSRYLGNLAQLSDAQALTVLRQTPELQHLRLRVTDGDGQVRIGADLPQSATERSVAWTVSRPEGLPWTVALVALPQTELLPTVLMALRDLVWFSLGAATVLGMLFWTLARQPDPLRTLAGRLQRAERMHRVATRQLLQAHAQEREQLAAGLAEGVGEHLTSLRIDTIWLRRRLAGDPQSGTVTTQMLAQISGFSRMLGQLLQPLLPPPALAPTQQARADGVLQQLHDALRILVRENTGPPCNLLFDADTTALPPALALAVYRMSHQALQHLDAQRPVDGCAAQPAGTGMLLSVQIDGSSRTLAWTAQALDGAPAVSSPSNALALLRATVTAFEGELRAETGPQGSWRLRAVLPLDG